MWPIEPSLELFFKLEGEKEFKSTGFMDRRDRNTGKPFPNFQIGSGFKFKNDTIIFVKYRDVKGKVLGPFKVIFDLDKELLKSCKIYQGRLEICKKFGMRGY